MPSRLAVPLATVVAVNTGQTLDDALGNAKVPAVGDVIVAFESSAGSYNGTVSCFYHSDVKSI